MMTPLAITGMGIINSLGSGVEETWQRILEKESGVKLIDWGDQSGYFYSDYLIKNPAIGVGALTLIPDCPEEKWEKDWRHLDPSIKLAVSVTYQAVKDSGLTSKNIAVIFGSIGAGHTRTDSNTAIVNGRGKYPPRKSLNIEQGHTTAVISRLFEFTGPSLLVHSACSTGLTAIDYAQRLLATDNELDAVIVGGADLPLEVTTQFYFKNLGALSDLPCRPMDINRAGFNLGEGAGAMVLERIIDAPQKRVYATILSVAAVTVGEHETSPDQAGKASKEAALKAIREARIDIKELGYINAHATGTEIGDIVEYNAMVDILPGRVLTANKGHIGHTICSSGILETAYTALALRDQITPPIAGLESPLGTGLILPIEKMAISSRYAIKNNYGFGGRAMSVILEK